MGCEFAAVAAGAFILKKHRQETPAQGYLQAPLDKIICPAGKITVASAGKSR
jgi:hypothetical protein